MSATVSDPARSRTTLHRVLLVVSFVVALALAMAIVLATLSGTPAGGASTGAPTDDAEVLSGQSVPTDEDDMSRTERACQLARVAGC